MKGFRYLGNRELVFGGGAIGTVADFAAGAGAGAGAGAAGSAGGAVEELGAGTGSKAVVLVITGEHFRSSVFS